MLEMLTPKYKSAGFDPGRSKMHVHVKARHCITFYCLAVLLLSQRFGLHWLDSVRVWIHLPQRKASCLNNCSIVSILVIKTLLPYKPSCYCVWGSLTAMMDMCICNCGV